MATYAKIVDGRIEYAPRYLTAAEVAANYAIDQRRFNIS